MSIKTIVDRTKGFTDSIHLLATKQVMVGVPAEKGTRSESGSINNAALAYIHDNGAPEAGIPPRPFMRPGIEAKKDEIAKRLRETAEAALDGRPEIVDRKLNAVGLIGQAAIRAKINEGPPPPLAAPTIAARQSRGRTGTKPLIDTGQLRNAINYVLRKVSR